MKKTILSILTFATIFAGAALWADEGDVYEVAACTQTGGDIAESAYPVWPLNSNDLVKVAGHTAYFRLRLAARDAAPANYWQLRYSGANPTLDWALNPPQICIFVSGAERWASLITTGDEKEINGFKFTDFVFEYTTQPGDFAMPIVLGAKVGSGTQPALDPSVTTPEYYLNLHGKWSFEFLLDSSTAVEPNWWFRSTKRPGVDRISDVNLANAGYNVQTVDFDSDWESTDQKTLWRSVHMETTIPVGSSPKLVRHAAAEKSTSLYVWSTNEAAVIVRDSQGNDGELVECDPENHPGVKYHVVQVTIGSSSAEDATGGFKLYGVSTNETASLGWSGLVMSPYKQFNLNPTTWEYYVDYITVPVRCVDPLPPSVMVTVEDSIAYATSDYKNAATKIKVSLSQPTTEKFKVRLYPAFTEDNVPLDPSEWGKYVRFSTSQDTVTSLPSADAATTEVELGGSVNEASVWVYALRGDTHTSGAVNAMEFQAQPEGDYPPEIVSFNKGQCQIVAQLPEIYAPETSAEERLEVIQYSDTPVTIKVAGSYADDADSAGYEIYVKYYSTDTTKDPGAKWQGFRRITGTYKPGDGGILERADDGSGDLPNLNWAGDAKETDTEVYVVAPVSGKLSCGTGDDFRGYYTIYANVSPTKSVWLEPADDKTEYNEGQSKGDGASLKVVLSDNANEEMYAFLQIESDDVKADQFASGTPYVIGMANAKGVKIARGKGSASSKVSLPQLYFLDGYGPATGGAMEVTFTVVLATVQDYVTATNKQKIVKGYEPTPLSLTINNVEPTVKRMELGGRRSSQSEYEYTFKLPKDQEQTLQAVVTEPSKYDLEHNFKCQWMFSVAKTRDGGFEDLRGDEGQQEIIGNPSTSILNYKFKRVGWYKIELRVKDKDMEDYPEDAYISYVEVISNPTITLDDYDDEPMENDTKEKLSFGLTNFDSAADKLYMKITVDPASTQGKGELLFDNQYRQAPAGYESHMATNVYFLTFESEVAQSMIITRMDGTAYTEATGIAITAEILNEEASSTGEPLKTYYKSQTWRIYPQNASPVVFFSPESNPTSRWTIAGGVANNHPLYWRLRSDVALDLESGIKVNIQGGGGTNAVYYAATSDTFVPDFGSSQGDVDVTISIEDKDGAIVSCTWYFTITSSKFLTTVAHGPSSGISTSTESKKYRSVAGLGEGHVWAGSPANFDSANNFWLKWNCSSATAVPVYSWGYKIANPLDDGTLDGGLDVKIDKSGTAKSSSAEIPEPFDYSEREMAKQAQDSFFYAWIIEDVSSSATGSSSSSKTYTVAISPEQPLQGATVGSVSLPTAKEQGATTSDAWPETQAEAVFSREYLWSDNMGDINADGIPDLWMVMCGFTTSSETTNDRTGTTTTETTEVSDISDVAAYNRDKKSATDEEEVGDYLPAPLGAQQLSGEVAVEFDAYTEVRGFGQVRDNVYPLNNAPQLAGVVGVRPEIRYTDPDKDGAVITNRSTLSKLEFEAWCNYAATLGIADPEDPASWLDENKDVVWSPERPSNPTLADTDSDGFPDGFEYWYWYRAHVGYYDAFGNHCYQTGRRFDPFNPAEGTLITSAEIEQQMDPIVRSNVNAKYADSDNDGLPDLLEYTLGTDPFDFDTDGDGLPDGWEVVVSCTDPCGKDTDATANHDGDAMAISSWMCEWAGTYNDRLPPKFDTFQTFAIVSDGKVQWYATKVLDEIELADSEPVAMSVVTLENGKQYATLAPAKVSVNGTLGAALPANQTYLLSEEQVPTLPAYVPAGVKATVEENVEITIKTLANDIAEDELHACWVYGRDPTMDSTLGELNTAGAAWGFLALGRNLAAPAGAQVCYLPSTSIDVAYLHYLVYEEFGFDPRTAWCPASPLHSRWATDYDDTYIVKQGGYTGLPTRTVAYANYDEFLVMSFFANNGTLTLADLTPTVDEPWSAIWAKYTTNPRGPGEVSGQLIVAASTEDDTDPTTEETAELSDNGADTDDDGVPDGWELYIMAGPKDSDGKYIFAPPHNGFVSGVNTALAQSYMSPFVKAAQMLTTDQLGVVGNDDFDGLTEFREFGGTDSVGYYAGICSNQTSAITIVRDATDAKWFNKFFPTDPWNGDTDGDGLMDGEEGGKFVYGTPEQDSSLTSIPGGGLNPCAIDTDLDGLPDEWEAQFAGKSVYAGELLEKTRTGDTLTGNSAFGLIDGMDGTVQDAYTSPNKLDYSASVDAEGLTSNTVVHTVTINRDYDHDGLENWQEYLVGAMRCWRYDDPVSSWNHIPNSLYWSSDGWNPQYSKLGVENEEEFWYRTLVDRTSPIYNPKLVTDMSIGNTEYFTRVENSWDPAYYDYHLSQKARDGAYYILRKWVGGQSIEDVWIGTELSPGPLADVIKNSGADDTGPQKCISCSPLDPDTDRDGMDDYYELFHGMNPLLGQSGYLSTSDGPYDVVADAWAKGGKSFYAWGEGGSMNYWQLNPIKPPRGTGYDFEVFPWLNGAATADPDGDDIRNQEEAIMPELATTTWHHTDPTPLWMTDTSYTNSLVSLYFRMPARFGEIEISAPTFTYDGNTYDFADYCGWNWDSYKRDAGRFPNFNADASWSLAAADNPNWAYSFEENEGFDTDHDGFGDFEELQGKFNGITNPQDADSPQHRQAMYFQGANRPSALQSPAYVKEVHPVNQTDYEDQPEFLLYTVECWVRPDAESVANGVYATIVERAIWTDESNAGDEEFLRCNFQLAIRNGFWYTKFDNRGTLPDSIAEVTSDTAASVGQWTHVAATFDGEKLTLYVNGKAAKPATTSLQPEYGASAVAVKEQTFEYNYVRERQAVALLIGASFKTCADGMPNCKHLDIENAMGWDCYKHFFKGYVDEVRIWDGARSVDDIIAAMNTRYTATEIKDNRTELYAQWKSGTKRYQSSGTASKYSDVLPELRYHYSFDGVSGAENEAAVAKVPHNFLALKGPWSRPEDWQIDWWRKILNAFTGTVYGDSRYVTWIHDTVSHLPRYDGTTWDSMYLSDHFKGDVSGNYYFEHDAEPGSRWVQMTYNGVGTKSDRYRSSSMRHHLVNSLSDDLVSAQDFEFTGRNLLREGADLLPLGGAYVKTLGEETATNANASAAANSALWYGSGSMSNWENTGNDSDADGLPDWWEDYADENYRINPGDVISWNTLVNYEGRQITAGEAYLYDIQRGAHMSSSGSLVISTQFSQTADDDGDGMPDYWELLYGIHQGGYLGTVKDATADPDHDGLSNYEEYMLSEIYPNAYKAAFEAAGAKVPKLNPKQMYSGADQKVSDYFLAYCDNLKTVIKTGDKSHFNLGEYFGEMVTDHDFMEDWWENQYDINYTSAKRYDPFADHDGDGWSTWAECRSSLWGGYFNADLTDYWTGELSDENVVCRPQPILSVRPIYNGVQNISGKSLIVRTISGQRQRVDATFVVPATRVPEDERKVRSQYLGPFVADTVMHGHMSPGSLNVEDVKFSSAKVSSDQIYKWSWDWYYDNGVTCPGEPISGSYDDYRYWYYRYPQIQLLGSSLSYATFAEAQRSSDATRAKIVRTSDQVQIGTLNTVTGEFELDMTKFVADSGLSVEDYVFKVVYTSRVGNEWPQTVYLSNTQELDDDTELAKLGASGYVREGANTVEAFMDLDEDGAWTPGEPFGVVKNVQVSWCKTPLAVIELKDTTHIVARYNLSSGTDDRSAVGDTSGSTIKSTASNSGLTKKIVIRRKTINEQTEFEYGDGLTRTVPVRSLVNKTLVLDDHPYLTEADVVSTGKYDLDWRWLVEDAKKLGLSRDDIRSVGYDIEEVQTLADGTTESTTLASFVNTFNTQRAKPVALSPINSASVYSSSPVLRFSSSDETMTAYKLQIRRANDSQLVFEEQRQLPGRISATDGVLAYEVEPEIYAGARVTNRQHPVFEDSTDYEWRVALYNAKFKEDEESAWSAWSKFQMDVGNQNRYPQVPTGYGSIAVCVRYYGAITNDLNDTIVVEAYDSPDFTGKPLAAIRLNGIDLLRSRNDIATPNAALRGVAPGTVYLRAYADLNDNGQRDDWESWGYYNYVGSDYQAIYNPRGLEVVAAPGNWTLGVKSDAIIYMEDCDLNQNEIPDGSGDDVYLTGGGGDTPVGADTDEDGIKDSEEDNYGTDASMWDSDSDGMPDGYEAVYADMDPLFYDAEESVDGDVMAYSVITAVVVTVQNSSSSFSTNYILKTGAEVPQTRDDADKLSLYSAFKYQVSSEGKLVDYVGRGASVTLAAPAGTTNLVVGTQLAAVVLVHAQVYDEYGYDPTTANPLSVTKVDDEVTYGAYTKAFTALDKYQLVRYFESMGIVSETEVNVNGRWSQWTLRPYDADNDLDGLPDGWELYVMFGTNPTRTAATMKISPWNSDDARQLSPSGEQTNLDEYDRGNTPTDPWQTHTIALGDAAINDAIAREFELKSAEDQLADPDNDGLSNWAEYRAWKANLGEFDVEDPMTDGVTYDYFRKIGSGDYQGWYVGEVVADHDFIDDVWEDEFSNEIANRYTYDANLDPDEDGWSNWAEAQAGTDPSKSVSLGLVNGAGENNSSQEYPVPTIRAQVTYPDAYVGVSGNLVVKAWRGDDTAGNPDAVWTIAGSEDATTLCTRYIGYNPNKVMHFNLGPGTVAQMSFNMEFFDPSMYTRTITWNTNRTEVLTVNRVICDIDTATWHAPLGFHDTPDSNGSKTGYFGFMGTKYDCGYINYETGEMTMDFGMFQYVDTTGSSDETHDYTTFYDLAHSFVRLTWRSRIVSNGNTKSVCLSFADVPSDANPSRGAVREGLNTFFAFLDVNNNGQYDADEPFGTTRNVQIGWNCQPDLRILLSDTAPAGDRFTVTSSNATDVVRIVRSAINGEPVTEYSSAVYAKVLKRAGDKLFTEADLLNGASIDFDGDGLVPAAIAEDIRIEDIRSVDYDVYVGVGATNSAHHFSRSFDLAPVAPAIVGACSNAGYVVRTAAPTLTWRARSGYPSFALQIASDAEFTKLVYSATNAMPAEIASGSEFQPPVYVGDELEDNTVYYWRVAQLNAKFLTNVWSKVASFRMAVDSSNADTGFGRLSADVRYYGPAENVCSEVVVAVYESADFASQPVARTHLKSKASVSTLANAGREFTNLVANVNFDGIAPGEYYVMAFIDDNHNGVRDLGESWGYVNNVGKEDSSLYTVVPSTVVATKAAPALALLVMEDTDVNQDQIPDCLEDLPAADTSLDSDGDGLKDDEEFDFGTDPYDPDTDDDGLGDGDEVLKSGTDPLNPDTDNDLVPDGWEIASGSNPFVYDSDEAALGDVMACEDVTMTFVKIGTSREAAEASDWLAVWDATDDSVYMQKPADEFGETLVTTWDAGNGLLGLGRMTSLPKSAGTVWEIAQGTARLVHAQVYAKNGFNSLTCVSDAFLRGTAVNTKAFTRADKYLVVRYLEAIGFEDVGAKGTLMNFHLDDTTDSDRDGIADGWELYTMLGEQDLKAMLKCDRTGQQVSDVKISPWNTADALQPAPAWNKYSYALTLLQEYDGGNATNPWATDTDEDGVNDYYAYCYLLKGSTRNLDSNGNGLSNYAEYFYNEVLRETPKVTAPRETNQSGEMQDYFRKLGDLYLGEIFTDHDQVNDEWEDNYAEVASSAKYDPARDDDDDGWSNYAEAKAGTRPDVALTPGVDDTTLINYPVPVIEAEVVYNGNNSKNTGYLVVKAWNDAKDPEMTSVPDAIWSFSTDSGESTEYSKYIGRKPDDQREYQLYGGAIAPGTVAVKFMDPNFFTRGVVNRKASESSTNNTYAASATWYAGITDKDGTLYYLANQAVGTVDYETGKVVIDFSKLTGYVMGNPQSDYLYAPINYNDIYSGTDYEVLTLENSYVKFTWSAQALGGEVVGKHYLVQPDAISTTTSSGSSSGSTTVAKQLGRVREGKNSFICYVASSAGGAYEPGQPFGCVRGVDVGWQGGKFRIEISEMNAITPRFSPWVGNVSDRSATLDESTAMNITGHSTIFDHSATGVVNQIDDTAVATGNKARLRIVRFALNETCAYLTGAGNEIRQPIVLERYYDKNGRDFIHEGDFLNDGDLDIEWNTLLTDVVENHNCSYGGSLTNVTYLAVLDGGEGNDYWILYGNDTNTLIRCCATTVERRFESKQHPPVGEGVTGVEYGARQTFTWSVPDEEPFAKRFGSSYTAFKLEITDAKTNVVYDSGVLRAPAIKNGKFTWTAPAVLASTGKWYWRVAMFNAKYSPQSLPKYWKWSDYLSFSTAVNAVQDMNDNGYSSIGVAVKYTGPVTVLSRLSSPTNGALVVQAFGMPDFSDEPLAAARVTDLTSVTNAYDLTVNCKLCGLAATGTYYVRAFIDSNGNGVKDAFESWGQVAEGVPLTTALTKLPQVGLFIEDADTDNDFYPDAYEYAMAGWTGDWDDLKERLQSNVDSSGKLLLSKEVTAAIAGSTAGVSSSAGGLRLTAFENPNLVRVLMGSTLASGESAVTMNELREAVAKQTQVKENSLKITAFNFDIAAKTVKLYFDAEVETSTAGIFLRNLYDLGDDNTVTVTIKVYQRQNLASTDWGTPKVQTVTITKGQAETQDVKFDELDTSSGYFKIEVEQ